MCERCSWLRLPCVVCEASLEASQIRDTQQRQWVESHTLTRTASTNRTTLRSETIQQTNPPPPRSLRANQLNEPANMAINVTHAPLPRLSMPSSSTILFKQSISPSYRFTTGAPNSAAASWAVCSSIGRSAMTGSGGSPPANVCCEEAKSFVGAGAAGAGAGTF